MNIPFIKFKSYSRGWVIGAGNLPLEAEFTASPKAVIREHYEMGVRDGRIAKGPMPADKHKIFGYAPYIPASMPKTTPRTSK